MLILYEREGAELSSCILINLPNHNLYTYCRLYDRVVFAHCTDVVGSMALVSSIASCCAHALRCLDGRLCFSDQPLLILVR